MVAFEVPEVDYTRYTNRQLAAVPLAVLAIALLIIAGWYVATGVPVNPGLEFTGGAELRVAVDAPDGQAREQIQAAFDPAPESIRGVPSDNTYILTFQTEEVGVSASSAWSCARSRAW